MMTSLQPPQHRLRSRVRRPNGLGLIHDSSILLSFIPINDNPNPLSPRLFTPPILSAFSLAVSIAGLAALPKGLFAFPLTNLVHGWLGWANPSSWERKILPLRVFMAKSLYLAKLSKRIIKMFKLDVASECFHNFVSTDLFGDRSTSDLFSKAFFFGHNLCVGFDSVFHMVGWHASLSCNRCCALIRFRFKKWKLYQHLERLRQMVAARMTGRGQRMLLGGGLGDKARPEQLPAPRKETIVGRGMLWANTTGSMCWAGAAMMMLERIIAAEEAHEPLKALLKTRREGGVVRLADLGFLCVGGLRLDTQADAEGALSEWVARWSPLEAWPGAGEEVEGCRCNRCGWCGPCVDFVRDTIYVGPLNRTITLQKACDEADQLTLQGRWRCPRCCGTVEATSATLPLGSRISA